MNTIKNLFVIKEEKNLFYLLLENTKNKDLDEIHEQLKPFEFNMDVFAEYYVQNEIGNGNDICDCNMHQLARIFQAMKLQPSPLTSSFIEVYGKIRHCKHNDETRKFLGY
jgi:hypothetical protein